MLADLSTDPTLVSLFKKLPFLQEANLFFKSAPSQRSMQKMWESRSRVFPIFF